jgi:thiamine biosynthesis lipoprotein
VTVIAAEGGLADAAATALAVAGPDEWVAAAQGLAIEHVMRVAADGAIEATPAMAERLVGNGRPQRLRVVPLDAVDGDRSAR